MANQYWAPYSNIPKKSYDEKVSDSMLDIWNGEYFFFFLIFLLIIMVIDWLVYSALNETFLIL